MGWIVFPKQKVDVMRINAGIPKVMNNLLWIFTSRISKFHLISTLPYVASSQSQAYPISKNDRNQGNLV